MTSLTDEQIESARAIVAQGQGPDAQWLDNQLHEYVSAVSFGCDEDVAEVTRRIYVESADWIGKKLYLST